MRTTRVVLCAVGWAWMSGPCPADEGDWRAPLKAQIREHRTSDFWLRVVTLDGRPVPDAEVEFELIRHDWTLGTAISTPFLLAESEEGERYRSTILELFNTVVMENDMKWKGWERTERRPSALKALDWVRRQGLRLRGHAMVWQTFRYGVPVPTDVVEAVRSGDPARRTEVNERVMNHIASICRQMLGQVEEWDVLNEQVEEHRLTEFLSPDVPFSGAPALVEWFHQAKKADPKARLFINDYHILVGDFENHKAGYERTIRFLLNSGAPLEGIGFQGHFYNGEHVRTLAQLRETLDRFAKFGLPMLVTEFDMAGGNWGATPEETDRARADFFEKFLLTLASHPQVQGLVVWGFWDGRHWMNSAPFFNKDWSEKGALGVYRSYVLDEWRTRGKAKTDADGRIGFRGFHGLYRVRANGAEVDVHWDRLANEATIIVTALAES